MSINLLRFSVAGTRTAMLGAALFVAACTQPNMAPQQVQASNPTVTYKYRGDQELLQAQQNAMSFCSQYRSIAQTLSIADTSDGNKVVVFQCASMAADAVPAQPLDSNLTYNYRTDQELLDASRNAEIYCRTNRSQRAISTGVSYAGGFKTATFQCVSP